MYFKQFYVDPCCTCRYMEIYAVELVLSPELLFAIPVVSECPNNLEHLLHSLTLPGTRLSQH